MIQINNSLIHLFIYLMLLFYTPTQLHSEVKWELIQNEHLIIGVDLERGACIGYFSEKQQKRNLLNHFDEGRFLQQSYYGKEDGSRWEGRNIDWVYNPVQGGSWEKIPSKTLDFQIVNNVLSSTIRPRHWASGELLNNAIMKQDIQLFDKLAKIDFSFTYTGDDQEVEKHQEMPALFVDSDLKYLCYTFESENKKEIPGLLSEDANTKTKGLRYGKSSSQWFAFVDDKDWGIGLYTPGTQEFTCYRAEGDGKTGPDGSSCSYIAPLRTFKLEPGLHLEYTVYLTIGHLSEISERFSKMTK